MKNISYEQLKKFLEENDYTAIQNSLNSMHPADVAALLNNLSDEEEIKKVFSLLSNENASEVLLDLHDNIKENILDTIKKERLVKIIDEMDSDEATDIISELDEETSEHVLKKIDKEESENIKKLLSYPEETAGALMQTEVIAVHKDMKRDEIIEYIRKEYEEVENLHFVFVVDNENKLVGELDIPKLLLAKPDATAAELMETDFVSVPVTMDQENVAHLFRKYDAYILPVVDEENHLLGRITVDDIIDVIDEEASEDAYKMVGLESEDRVFTPPLQSVRKRLPWLTLNLFTALIISSVVGIFEETIAKMSVLAVLMPIVAGLGGNSGIQTLTVITRGIALGELSMKNSYQAILKQVLIGIINGVIIGTFAALIAWVLKGNMMIGVVLGLAMICNMFIAGLMGSFVPIFLKSIKVDPALASGILITMLTDIGGYASFLGLATILIVNK
jgi:magnesium transporter